MHFDRASLHTLSLWPQGNNTDPATKNRKLSKYSLKIANTNSDEDIWGKHSTFVIKGHSHFIPQTAQLFFESFPPSATEM